MVRQLRAGAEYSRFPLVQRPRPVATPLATRVRELRELAAREDEDNAIIRAAQVCNKAALIASDCGLADLARDLCWQQYDAFAQAGHLRGRASLLALQPLLNLPRQRIRESDGEGAYAMLMDLYHGVRERGDVLIGGRHVSLSYLTGTPEDHQAACSLVWASVLADGTRALVLSGRLGDAARHAETHRGVGQRLLDGRQAVILALIGDGDVGQASALVEQSSVVEPWERAVQGVLWAICLLGAGADAERAIEGMLDTVLALLARNDATTTLFRVRVGMTALDLACAHPAMSVSELRAELIAAARSDGYSARELLACPLLRPALTADQRTELAGLMRICGLDPSAVPESLRGGLISTASLAEGRLRALVSGITLLGMALGKHPTSIFGSRDS